MEETKVIFILDNVNTIIKCSKEDKMENICQKYATQINKNKNNLLFLYEGTQVNFELSFNSQANFIDKNNKNNESISISN